MPPVYLNLLRNLKTLFRPVRPELRRAAVPDGNVVLVDSSQEYKPFWWPPLLPPRVMWCAHWPRTLYMRSACSAPRSTSFACWCCTVFMTCVV